MKRTTSILVLLLAAGQAWAQNPQIIQNTREKLNTVQKNATAASNEALGLKATAASNNAGSAKTAAKTVAVKPASTAASTASQKAQTKPTVLKVAEPVAKKVAPSPKPSKVAKAKVDAAPAKASEPVQAAAAPEPAPSTNSAQPANSSDSEQKDAQDKKWSMTGKRDPFVSPVVNHAGGSGCSTGKKCLEIGAINLRGVVRSDAGFIAVVTNSLNKAYFLRENDPVFDGYVVKITGDSIVFQETLQDRLGKSFTREVVKKITTPAV